LKAAKQFDPKRASVETFVDRVVSAAVRMLVRDRHRHKCGNGFATQFLESTEVLGGETPEPLSVTISEEDLARRTGATPYDETQHREDAEAIQYALSEMPDELRSLCRRVMGGTLASVARELGVTRRRLQTAVSKAREYLERAGFDF